MKVAVFSDIHGNYQALQSILNDINKNEFDKVICLGDLIGLGPSSNDCLKLLNNSNVIYILGNHELYYKHIMNPKEERIPHSKWVRSTISEEVDGKLDYELNINNMKILFTHYFFKDENNYESFHLFNDKSYIKVLDKFNYNYVFYGHLHTSRNDVINKKHYYCLDSSGCVKDNKTFYYLIDIDKDVKVEKIELEYDRDKLIESFKNNDYPERDEIALKFFDIKL